MHRFWCEVSLCLHDTKIQRMLGVLLGSPAQREGATEGRAILPVLYACFSGAGHTPQFTETASTASEGNNAICFSLHTRCSVYPPRTAVFKQTLNKPSPPVWTIVGLLFQFAGCLQCQLFGQRVCSGVCCPTLSLSLSGTTNWTKWRSVRVRFVHAVSIFWAWPALGLFRMTGVADCVDTSHILRVQVGHLVFSASLSFFRTPRVYSLNSLTDFFPFFLGFVLCLWHHHTLLLLKLCACAPRRRVMDFDRD